MSSRLFTEVRERRGLAYYVFAVIQGYADTGSLFTQAGVDIKRIDEAVTTIVAELKKIAEEPVPADRAREGALVHEGALRALARVAAGDEPLRPAPRGARERPPGSERGARRGSSAVTAEDVQRVAQELITDDALRLALVGPFDDADRFEKLLP